MQGDEPSRRRKGTGAGSKGRKRRARDYDDDAVAWGHEIGMRSQLENCYSAAKGVRQSHTAFYRTALSAPPCHACSAVTRVVPLVALARFLRV